MDDVGAVRLYCKFNYVVKFDEISSYGCISNTTNIIIIMVIH